MSLLSYRAQLFFEKARTVKGREQDRYMQASLT